MVGFLNHWFKALVVVKKSYVIINIERCKGCYLCVETCPRKCIGHDSQLNAAGYYPACVVENGCIGCALCGIICPDAAIEVFKEE